MPKLIDPAQAEKNRSELRSLCDNSNLTQKECAALIEKTTMRPCPERTLRTWLADPETSSSRPAPDWAVQALKKGLQEAGKRKKSSK